MRGNRPHLAFTGPFENQAAHHGRNITNSLVCSLLSQHLSVKREWNHFYLKRNLNRNREERKGLSKFSHKIFTKQKTIFALQQKWFN